MAYGLGGDGCLLRRQPCQARLQPCEVTSQSAQGSDGTPPPAARSSTKAATSARAAALLESDNRGTFAYPREVECRAPLADGLRLASRHRRGRTEFG